MKIDIKKISLLLIIIFTMSAAYGNEFSKVGTRGAKYLEIPIGARGAALSGAYAVMADDASSVFWNPAGLAKISSSSIMIDQSMWLLGTNNNAVAYAKAIPGIGVLALSGTYFTSGEIDVTDVMHQNGTGETFSANAWTIGIGIARQMTDHFSVGINTKLIHENLLSGIGDDSGIGNTIAADVGSFYQTEFRELKFGMTMRNFGGTIQPSGEFIEYQKGDSLDIGDFDGDGDTGELLIREFRAATLPMLFQFGFSIKPLTSVPWIYAMNVEQPGDNVLRVNLASEYSLLNDMIVFRTGYSLGAYGEDAEWGQGHDTRGFTGGLGVKVPGVGLKIDLSYTDYDLLSQVYAGSVTFDF